MIGEPELRRQLQLLKTDKVPKAVDRAVRYALKTVPPAIAKEVGSHYSLKAARIKEDISTVLSPRGAAIKLRIKPPTVEQFAFKGPRTSLSKRTPTYMSWAIYRGARRTSKRGFVARSGKSHTFLPFHRLTKARKPIDVLHGPSLWKMYVRGKYADDMQAIVNKKIEDNLLMGAKRALRQYTKGYGQ